MWRRPDGDNPPQPSFRFQKTRLWTLHSTCRRLIYDGGPSGGYRLTARTEMLRAANATGPFSSFRLLPLVRHKFTNFLVAPCVGPSPSSPKNGPRDARIYLTTCVTFSAPSPAQYP